MISARGSVFVLLLLTLGTMVGQSKGSLQTVQKQASEKRLSVLLESISALPPEYKADLAFTLLDSTSSRLSPVRTRTLLDDVFKAAGTHVTRILALMQRIIPTVLRVKKSSPFVSQGRMA